MFKKRSEIKGVALKFAQGAKLSDFNTINQLFELLML